MKISLYEFLTSKETVVLRRWERSKQKFSFIKRVDKGWITTVVIQPLSTRLIKPNFCFYFTLCPGLTVASSFSLKQCLKSLECSKQLPGVFTQSKWGISGFRVNWTWISDCRASSILKTVPVSQAKDLNNMLNASADGIFPQQYETYI